MSAPRIGVIGTNWGRMHIGGFRGAGADIVALCGRELDKTQEVAAIEGVPLATTSVQELAEACEIVVVASPDALHHDHTTIALRAGRAVLCEKPLGRTLGEATALARLAAERRTQFCAISLPYRMIPPVGALRGWLDGRTVRWLSVTIRNGFANEAQTPESDIVGLTGDFNGMSHIIDAALWLTRSKPARVQSALRGRPAHSVGLHVETTGGSLLSISQLGSSEPGIRGIWHLMGDGWEARFPAHYAPEAGGWAIGPSEVYEDGAWRTIGARVEPKPWVPEPWGEAHHAIARAFLSAWKGEPRSESLATFEEGVAVQRILHDAVEQARA